MTPYRAPDTTVPAAPRPGADGAVDGGSTGLWIAVVDPSDDGLCERLGQIVRSAYVALPGHVPEADYEAELTDVCARARRAVVAAAWRGGEPLGCVTYAAGPHLPMAEHDDPDAASFRMLGIDPAAQGSGAGHALVRWCIHRARAEGRARLVIHSTTWMTGAHRLYAGLGFVRCPDLDWTPAPGVHLLGFVLELAAQPGGETSSA